MTRFRPCIDLHAGQVKQIVGGTLSDTESSLRTNHVSQQSAGHFAQLYKDNGLRGAHVIMLGPGNEDAAKQALAAWPDELQLGGGINNANAQTWLDVGAGKVIVTSYLFPGAKFSMERLKQLSNVLQGGKEKLVIDLSCRRKDDTWFIAMNKWQTFTDMELCRETFELLEPYCSEFLVHAADNEGLQKGIDEDLVRNLASWCRIPVTYAGGSRSVDDLRRVEELSDGQVDLTIGSALDIFGGSGVKLDDCIRWNRSREA